MIPTATNVRPSHLKINLMNDVRTDRPVALMTRWTCPECHHENEHDFAVVTLLVCARCGYGPLQWENVLGRERIEVAHRMLLWQVVELLRVRASAQSLRRAVSN